MFKVMRLWVRTSVARHVFEILEVYGPGSLAAAWAGQPVQELSKLLV